MAARVARLAVPWGATTAVLFALWLFFVDTTESPQLYVGIGVAMIAATGSELVRLQRIAMLRPWGRWLLRLWRPAVSVPADLWRLARAAARGIGGAPPEGRFREVPFEAGEEDPEDVARQALAEAAGSFSPNTIVIGVDVERRTLLAHQLLTDEDDPVRAIDPLGLGEARR